MSAEQAVVTRDVLIVGAGLAGSASATVLARRGLSVTVIDPYAEFPPLFRAEKIEPDQAALLQSLGLLDKVKQKARIISEIIHGRAGRMLRRRQIEQFGISYCDIVNQVRAQIPELGVEKRMVKEELSMAFGFMLERTDGQAFPFDAVTYYTGTLADKVGYVTLFRMGNAMRANIFAYWPAKDATTKELLREPATALPRLLPGLDQLIGSYAVQGKIEPFKIDLYRMQHCARAGMVLIGDAYQSVCPSTGMGLSKVLTDVEVLCNEFVPRWMAAGSIATSDVAAFYAHERKNAVDDRALHLALAGRDSVLATSLRWRVQRLVRAWRFAHGG